jgi:hypothetical protein
MDEWRLKVLEQEHRVVQSLRPKANLLVKKDFSVHTVKDGELQ